MIRSFALHGQAVKYMLVLLDESDSLISHPSKLQRSMLVHSDTARRTDSLSLFYPSLAPDPMASAPSPHLADQ